MLDSRTRRTTPAKFILSLATRGAVRPGYAADLYSLKRIRALGERMNLTAGLGSLILRLTNGIAVFEAPFGSI